MFFVMIMMKRLTHYTCRKTLKINFKINTGESLEHVTSAIHVDTDFLDFLLIMS